MQQDNSADFQTVGSVLYDIVGVMLNAPTLLLISAEFNVYPLKKLNSILGRIELKLEEDSGRCL